MKLNRKLLSGIAILALIGCGIAMTFCTPFGILNHKEEDMITSMRRRGHNALREMRFVEAYVIGDSLLGLKLNNEARSIEARIMGLNMKGQSVVFAPEYTEDPFQYFTEAEVLCNKSDNNYMLAAVYNGFGNYYLHVKKNRRFALLYFFKGLNAAKKGENNKAFSTLLANISKIYFENEDPTGLRYAIECHDLGKAAGLERIQLIGCLYTGFFYALREEYELAMGMMKEAELKMASQGYMEDAQIPMIYGETMRLLGNYDEAERNMKAAMKYSNGVTLQTFIKTSICYAKLLIQKKDHTGAISVLEAAEEKMNKEEDLYFKPSLLKSLADAHLAAGHKEIAGKYSQAHREASDSEAETNSKEEYRTLKSHYDMELAENAIVSTQLKLEKERRRALILIAIICIIIAVAVVLYVQYRKKSRLYAAIVKQTGEAVKTEKILRETIGQLEQKIKSIEMTPPDEEEDIPTVEPAPEHVVSPGTSLNKEKYLEIKMRLESLMLNPAIYTSKEITKDKVAKMIGTNRTYLSHVINDSYRVSFTKFINNMRIKEAVRRLADLSDDIPIKQLASDLGFNSLTTFYAQFVAETGLTPAKYREQSLALQNKTAQDDDLD